jgi:MoxR-like ATPase
VKLVRATRAPESVGQGQLSRLVQYGASPRASINLILAGRALALMRGREYALPQDVRDVAFDVIRHRLVLSYEALADNVSADDILRQLVPAIALPEASFIEGRGAHAIANGR